MTAGASLRRSIIAGRPACASPLLENAQDRRNSTSDDDPCSPPCRSFGSTRFCRSRRRTEPVSVRSRRPHPPVADRRLSHAKPTTPISSIAASALHVADRRPGQPLLVATALAALVPDVEIAPFSHAIHFHHGRPTPRTRARADSLLGSPSDALWVCGIHRPVLAANAPPVRYDSARTPRRSFRGLILPTESLRL